jgi:glycosyltransferase involved in cell wall biosynthesis
LRVAFIGRGENDYADVVRKMLGRAADVTQFVGESDMAPAAIAAADILVNTSRSEAFPRTFIEAGNGHTAIIASAIDGTTERLKDEVSALFYNPGDPAALARHVVRLANAPDERARLAKGAHTALIANWTYQEMIQSYDQHIDDALKSSRVEF